MVRTISDTWLKTSRGEPRAYIQPQGLEELWLHTGTNCNLRCPFCFEGARPGNHRVEPITLADARPFIDEALELGVKKFSFTGGEPFINPDFLDILGYALQHRPCLVLSNGTRPLLKKFDRVGDFKTWPHPLSFRISLDYPNPETHDRARGKGNFQTALNTMARLYQAGFGVSIARQGTPDEDTAAVDLAYAAHLAAAGLPVDTRIVSFPDLHRPGDRPAAPEITETCMTTHLTEEQRHGFMCNQTKMIVKQNGRCAVYACTLVDDDPGYDLGASLKDAMGKRIMLRHHRCFCCFSCGASCSE